ncbi:Protein FAR1-RELATED SEQUENCE 5 [Morella rubra]|uniref:Protein FAR1-RELATED SEQUENCE n=1 Tax=Morella rubra TaxID=262757 RepID=A0A6A1WQ33_9ROSI|nr:Protein FAR1-RELATED SEQUENCE 5 [Morella rubra]
MLRLYGAITKAGYVCLTVGWKLLGLKTLRYMYAVWPKTITVQHQRYVIHEENGVYHCSCKYFNFLGIICSHIIFVMRAKRFFAIPDAYILSRWIRDARRTVAPINRSQSTDDPTILKVVNRRRYVNQFASLRHRHRAKNKSWPIFDHYYQELEKELDQLLDEVDLAAPASDGSEWVLISPLLQKVHSGKAFDPDESEDVQHSQDVQGPPRSRCWRARLQSEPGCRDIALARAGALEIPDPASLGGSRIFRPCQAPNPWKFQAQSRAGGSGNSKPRRARGLSKFQALLSAQCPATLGRLGLLALGIPGAIGAGNSRASLAELGARTSSSQRKDTSRKDISTYKNK